MLTLLLCCWVCQPRCAACLCERGGAEGSCSVALRKKGVVFSFLVRGWRLSALFAACLCGAPVLRPPSRHQRSFLHAGSPIEYTETVPFVLQMHCMGPSVPPHAVLSPQQSKMHQPGPVAAHSAFILGTPAEHIRKETHHEHHKEAPLRKTIRVWGCHYMLVKKILVPIIGALREVHMRLSCALQGLRGCMTYDHQIQRMGRLVPPRRGFVEVAASTARGFRDFMPPNGQGRTAGKQSA